jgi:colanic acid/amylovoran biosynthesis glycosyltransferase
MIRRHHGRVLHSHFGNKGWEDAILAQSAGLKHVVTFYGADLSLLPRREPKWYQRYEELFRQVDLILCEGPFMAKAVINLGCPENKVRVHHLGVDLKKFPFQPLVWQQQEPLKVLISASFREKKGIPFALAALGELQEEVELEISIIGGAAGEEASRLEEQKILQVIEDYKLHSQVRFMGFQPYDKLIEQMYENHIFLSPSVVASDGNTEGGAPVSLIEAAAAGMVIVSTTHCDIPEVILHGETGLLAPERNVDELVNHLRWLLKNPNSWQALRESGRKRVEQEFNAFVQAERLATLYKCL